MVTKHIQSKSAPGIIIQNAKLQYGTTCLFERLKFSLVSEQWTCLLGPSGVGKSSLLRLIAGLTMDDTQTKASFTLAATDNLPLAGRVAYMAQQDLLMPWLNVIDNVLIGAKLRSKSLINSTDKKNIYSRALFLLEKVGLANFTQQYPKQLSGGMRQRVALVRTLLEDCPIVLMDEPFSALDAITRARLQELASELLQNKTVLLITHDPLEALRLGHKVFILTGQPAQLNEAISPHSPPIRQVTDKEVLLLQGELLRQLELAQETL